MDLAQATLLSVAAAIGGALNAVAGGGSFFTFPSLVLVGVAPIPANATSTLALWPGSVASAVAYRRDLATEKQHLWWFAAMSVLGGVAGALLLVFTPSDAFEKLVPFLLLVATVLFAIGPRLTARLRGSEGGAGKAHALSFRTVVLVQLLISVYGGYFGGGMGMMMLAAYALMGMDDIHKMNGLKTVLAVGINAAALVTFILSGTIVWSHGLLMTAGAVVGGYGGVALAKKVRQQHVRAFIVFTGLALSVVFFLRAFF